MISTEKIHAVVLLFISASVTALSALASFTTQDFVTLAGALTTVGLAALNLYQRFREEKRKQDSADMALHASSLRARIEALEGERIRLSEELEMQTAEAQRWLKLYRATQPAGPA